jgi:uncharacterized membrane protein YdjX (TVP38/TMEM64 family)
MQSIVATGVTMTAKNIVRYSIVAFVAAGVILAILYRDQLDAAVLEQWVADSGNAGPLVFMLVYAIGTVFFLPGSVLTLAGGALFGPFWGTFYNLTAATIGAGISFLVARYIASDWAKSKSKGMVKNMINGVDHEGWRFVAFVRLVPLFPFNLLNYALGVTRIRFSHYLLASYICMLPGSAAYTYLGYAAKETVAGEGDIQQKIHIILIATALLAVVAYIPRIIARLRRGPSLDVAMLKEQIEKGDAMLVLDVRSAEDYIGEQGHINGSLNIPLEELPERFDELSDYLEKPIAIVCRTDRRSAKAAQILAQHGYADVHVVKNGMTAWNEKAFPVYH